MILWVASKGIHKTFWYSAHNHRLLKGFPAVYCLQSCKIWNSESENWSREKLIICYGLSCDFCQEVGSVTLNSPSSPESFSYQKKKKKRRNPKSRCATMYIVLLLQGSQPLRDHIWPFLDQCKSDEKIFCIGVGERYNGLKSATEAFARL